MTRRLRPLLPAIAWLSLLAAASVTAGDDPQALFSEGNDKARRGLYHSALKQYRAAREAGLDTPLLHYNMGIAHYRSGQFRDARQAFRTAVADPRLATIATYNLGLVARANGDRERARRYFEDVIARGDSAKLTALAERALSRTRRAAHRERRRDSDSIGRFALQTQLSVGYEGNVYRTPSGAYVDLSQPGQPLVIPQKRSGTVAPVSVDARYYFPGVASSEFFLGYHMDGRIYTGAELENANEFSHGLSFGNEMYLAESADYWTRIHSAFFARLHDETNFDPDDGLERDLNGEDLSERFSYRSAGIEVDHESRLGRWGYGLDLVAELRDYEETLAVDEFDHEHYRLGGFGSYELIEGTRLGLGAGLGAREYAQRHPRDLNGALLLDNPALEYQYLDYETFVVQRVARNFLLRFDYVRSSREDEFVGYYDYDLDSFRLRGLLRLGRKLKTTFAVRHRRYDYPRAFAFDDPAAGARALDVTSGLVNLEFQVWRNLAVAGEVYYVDVSSSDPRINFDRQRATLGLKWQL